MKSSKWNRSQTKKIGQVEHRVGANFFFFFNKNYSQGEDKFSLLPQVSTNLFVLTCFCLRGALVLALLCQKHPVVSDLQYAMPMLFAVDKEAAGHDLLVMLKSLDWITNL